MAVQFVLNKEKLPQFLKNVRQEILNVRSGEAKWRTGPPLHFEEGKAVPVNATLERFQDNPTKKTFDDFIRQASQDLGRPTGDGFATWGMSLWSKVIDDTGKEPKVDKTFAATIKDGFYDCFKVAHISLDQKQVDLLAAAAGRMAVSIDKQVFKHISSQLDTLVARVKKAEEIEAEKVVVEDDKD